MILHEFSEKIKHFHGVSHVMQGILKLLGLVMLAFLFFGLGRLSKIEEGRAPVTIENRVFDTASAGSLLVKDNSTKPLVGSVSGGYVGSRNGSKYHLPWCSGAKRIKEENKVWFATIEDAKSAGYSPAANCKGI